MFDPYHKWLGIPKDQRPPTYYQLLGIAPDEQDVEVIEEAAIRQTAHVRAYQTGPYAEDCRRILEEIAQARVVLRDPAQRSAYDATLQKSERVRELESESAEELESGTEDGFPIAPIPLRRRTRRFPWSLYAGIILLPTAVIGVVAAVLMGDSIKRVNRESEQQAAVHGGPTNPATPNEAPRPSRPSASTGSRHDTSPKPPTTSRPVPATKPMESPLPPPTEPKPPEAVTSKPPEPPADSLPAKVAVPTDADQAKAEKDIKDVFKAEYAKRKPAERLALAAKLLQQAGDTKDDPAARFVLLREARDVAAQAGDFNASWRAVVVIDQWYEIDPAAMKLATLETTGQAATTSTLCKQVAETAVALVDERLADDDFEAANALIRVADAAAKKFENPPLERRVQRSREEVASARKEYEKFQAAAELLRNQPDDPQANETVGRYQCLRKGSWDEGLPMLVKGNDAAIKAVAVKDLANPTDAGAQVEVADAWSDLAEKEGEPGKTLLLLRSKYWYGEAVGHLAGLAKTRVEKRLAELAKVTGAAGATSALAKLPPGGFTLAARRGAARAELLRLGGGTAESEAAVALGLQWIVQQQQRDGHWHFQNEGGLEVQNNDIAATALALLAFLGAGDTHRHGGHQNAVNAGLHYLIAKQNKKNGDLGGGMYSHAMATIALCEIYGLTGDIPARTSAQHAIDFIVQAQGPGHGGWRYAPKSADGDISVTAWQVTALKTGQQVGLRVPPTVWSGAEKYLNACQQDGGAKYSYQPGQAVTPAMTAAALLSREYLGWNLRRLELDRGCQFLLATLPPDQITAATRAGTLYYYYYATQVLHHVGGDKWNQWNPRMRDFLIATQIKDGPGRGSWEPNGTDWGKQGGRIYSTSFALLTLEVYYRHVPMHLREERKADTAGGK